MQNDIKMAPGFKRFTEDLDLHARLCEEELIQEEGTPEHAPPLLRDAIHKIRFEVLMRLSNKHAWQPPEWSKEKDSPSPLTEDALKGYTKALLTYTKAAHDHLVRSKHIRKDIYTALVDYLAGIGFALAEDLEAMMTDNDTPEE